MQYEPGDALGYTRRSVLSSPRFEAVSIQSFTGIAARYGLVTTSTIVYHIECAFDIAELFVYSSNHALPRPLTIMIAPFRSFPQCATPSSVAYLYFHLFHPAYSLSSTRRCPCVLESFKANRSDRSIDSVHCLE